MVYKTDMQTFAQHAPETNRTLEKSQPGNDKRKKEKKRKE